MRVGERGTRPMLRASAEILWRIDGIGAERGGGMPGPSWVIEKPARQGDAIGPAFGDHRFGLMRVGDQPTAWTAMSLAFLTAAANGTW